MRVRAEDHLVRDMAIASLLAGIAMIALAIVLQQITGAAP